METKKSPVLVRERSIMSASFMGLFFVVELIAGRYGIGTLRLGEQGTLWSAYIGCAIVVLGVIINLIARIQLGSAWSNDIVIYQGHKLFDKGLYGYMRHPLYSSIIFIALGLSVLYTDYLSLFLTVVLFIPMIYYRTVKEEAILRAHLSGYAEYVRVTPMFIPFPVYKFFSVKKADVNKVALRLCRVTTVVLLLISLVIQSWWLVAIVLILMLYSTITSISHSPLVVLYSRLLRKSRWSSNTSVDTNAIRFAQGFGSTLLIIAIFLYFVFNHPLGAGILVSIVLLSTAMGSLGYCLGAYIYFGLRKLHGRDRIK
jgi:protein-S-isoprenylcysteine O-methyltransferase Ste14